MLAMMGQIGLHPRCVGAIKDELTVTLTAAFPSELVVPDHLVEAFQTPSVFNFDLAGIGTACRFHLDAMPCRRISIQWLRAMSRSARESVLARPTPPPILRQDPSLGNAGDRRRPGVVVPLPEGIGLRTALEVDRFAQDQPQPAIAAMLLLQERVDAIA